MNIATDKDTVTAMVSRTLASRKRASVKDIEPVLKKAGYQPSSAYWCLHWLGKYGFAVPREDGKFEHVTTLSPTQDTILKHLERKRRKTALKSAKLKAKPTLQ